MATGFGYKGEGRGKGLQSIEFCSFVSSNLMYSSYLWAARISSFRDTGTFLKMICQFLRTLEGINELELEKHMTIL